MAVNVVSAMDFVQSLRSESDALEQSIRTSPDPRALKLLELKKVLALYVGKAHSRNVDVGAEPVLRPIRQARGEYRRCTSRAARFRPSAKPQSRATIVRRRSETIESIDAVMAGQ
jgi:hypothetical protein